MAKWTYLHNMDPFILALTENVGLRWYSMAYIASFFLAYVLLTQRIKKNETALSKTDLMDLIFYVALGVVLGGRLGYALFYAPYLFTEWGADFPYWELIAIHKGGLASHGGIVGLISAVCWFAWRRKLSAFHCLDMTVLGGTIGIFFGRVANFINGELYGRVIEKTAWLSVQFPQEMIQWVSDKNTRALNDLSLAVSQLKNPISQGTWRDWVYQLESTGQQQSQIYSVVYALIKAVETGHQEVISSLKAVLSHRHPSQIYQALLEGLLPFLIIWLVWKKRAFFIRLFPFLKEPSVQLSKKEALRPGLIAGIWCLCYSVARIAGEQFRMPDGHIGLQALELTRGQWLTLFMLIGLVIYFVLVFKKRYNSSS